MYKDRPYLVETNYEWTQIWPTRRARILIYLFNKSFIAESRADFHQGTRLHKIVSSLLGIRTHVIGFTDEDIERIKEALHAVKRAARHKRSGGEIDIIEMIASPTLLDLDDSEEYREILSGDEVSKAGYKFPYTTEDGVELDITMNINNKGSIWFVSPAPEEVRSHVFSCIKRVKGL